MKTIASYFVVDSHTYGHPTRVIMSGVPKLQGLTVLEQREDFRVRFDHLRPRLLHEPRGHAATFGCIPVASNIADFGAIFISTYVYLDMCGHGTIGLAKTLAATGQISPDAGTSFSLETPAGLVAVHLKWRDDGELESVRLKNVPAYIGLEKVEVRLFGFDVFHTDIVYAGAWYALVDADKLGIQLVPDRVSEAQRMAVKLKSSIKETIKDDSLLLSASEPYILFYSDIGPGEAVQMLVMDINKFDRSPCGTGTTARVAQLVGRGDLNIGENYLARNIFGIPFIARAVEKLPSDRLSVEVEGIAHLSAFSTLVFEEDDPLRNGFLCR